MKNLIIASIMALTLLLAACGGSYVDETATGTLVGKIEERDLGPGRLASATFDLSPGSYVLICNISGHYDGGMYAPLQVIQTDSPSPTTVSVELGEWFVRPQVSSLTAGSITFQTTNKGESGHNLVIIKTDLAPGALVIAK